MVVLFYSCGDLGLLFQTVHFPRAPLTGSNNKNNKVYVTYSPEKFKEFFEKVNEVMQVK